MGWSLLSRGFALLILLGLVCLPLFLNLGQLPIQLWDESRLAVNALEMAEGGDWLVTRFAGSPDLWNTKPPLMIWLQALGMQLLGPTEWAVRLPSAVAGLLTCILLFVFALGYTGRKAIAVFSVLALVSTWGYVTIHGTRTGDYDALLALFTTAGAVAFFLYCESPRPWRFYAACVAGALAVLTKSVAGLLFAPGLLLYAVVSGRLPVLLRSRHTYLGLMAMLGLIAAYYLLREMQAPGYLAAVQQNELSGRFDDVIENHTGDLLTYLKVMLKGDYLYWAPFAAFGAISGLMAEDPRARRLARFCLVVGGAFVIVISLAATKLPWYVLPLYPLAALLVGLALTTILDWSRGWWSRRQVAGREDSWAARSLAPYLLPVALIVPAYGLVLGKTLSPESRLYTNDEPSLYDLSLYLREAATSGRDLDRYHLLYGGYNAHQTLYLERLADQGVEVEQSDWDDLAPGDLVMASQQAVKSYLEATYRVELREAFEGVGVYQILGLPDRPSGPDEVALRPRLGIEQSDG